MDTNDLDTLTAELATFVAADPDRSMAFANPMGQYNLAFRREQ